MRFTHSVALALAFCSLGFCQTSGTGAQAQAVKPAPQASPAPTQVTLTSKQIDSFVNANKDVSVIEAKLPSDGKPDPKLQADLDSAAKKFGFSNYEDYSNVGAAISMVIEGVDPDTKKFVGSAAVLNKQIASVQADKTMPAKDKKAALEELNDALKSAGSERPTPGNIDIVVQNFDKLSALMGQD